MGAASTWARASRTTDDGRLVISGQDLGPVTRPISSDGEYEYAYTVAAEDVPSMMVALGGVSEDEDVLAILERDWSGARSYGLGAAMRESGVPYEFWNWS
jgi:hypothetical protein